MIAQLDIGHSFITHSFLLKGEDLPVCIGCDKHLTIKDILLACSDFIETREPSDSSVTVGVLFEEISTRKDF